MIKGVSLILIGIGLFVSASLSIFESYAILFSVDEPLRLEMTTMVQSALDSLVVENEYNDAIFSLLTGLIQIKAVIIILMIGGILYFKEQKKPKPTEEKNKVSTIWQIIGSTIPGFDLWVMYRIGKIKHGSIVFSIQYALFMALFFTDMEDYLEIEISLLVTVGYAIVVYLWSKKWNKQFNENIKNKDEKRVKKRGKLLLSISGGMFFLVFVLFSLHAVMFMGTWDKLNLEESQEGVSEAIFNEVPQLIWVDFALVGFIILGPIFAIVGVIFWYKDRHQEMNKGLNTF